MYLHLTLHTWLFLTLPPDFQYQNEKRVATNRSYFVKKIRYKKPLVGGPIGSKKVHKVCKSKPPFIIQKAEKKKLKIELLNEIVFSVKFKFKGKNCALQISAHHFLAVKYLTEFNSSLFFYILQ